MHQMERIAVTLATSIIALAICLTGGLVGCSDDDKGLPAPGAGVVFSYPGPGQLDVPLTARIVVAFSDAVDADALGQECQLSGEAVTGGLCLIGPDRSVVPGAVAVVGDAGNAVHFTPDALAPGESYELFVAPSLLEGIAGTSGITATNLSLDAPLVAFRTRQSDVRSGEAPVVIAVNGDAPEAFMAGTTTGPRHPFVAFASVRVVLSEPLDPRSVIAGDTFRFVKDDGGAGESVAGTLLVQGIHLSFDPDEDLEAGATYRMELGGSGAGAELRDLGGEILSPVSFVFTPADSRINGELIEQVLNADPTSSESGFPLESPLSGMSANSLQVTSPVIGSSETLVRDVSIRSQLANPASFKEQRLIPITMRKGQLLAASGLDVAFGGVIPAALDTGDIEIHFLSDANGFLIRNPFRDLGQIPDDDQSPVTLVLSLDIAVTATDSTGNAVLNQTVLGVQATGAAIVSDGALAIEAVGTLELDLLGVASAATHMDLRLSTGPGPEIAVDDAAPRVQATYPAPGQDDFATDDNLLVIFDEPVDSSVLGNPAVIDDLALRDEGGAVVDVAVSTSGSTLIIAPQAPLTAGTGYTLTLDGDLADLTGNPVSFVSDDATGGTGSLTFSTAPSSTAGPAAPVLVALSPGAPCALVDDDDTDDSPGRCVGSDPDDGLYRSFVAPGFQAIQGDFNQAMDPGSLTLGDACGSGSVRVERLDSAGVCEAPVPGTLAVRQRGFRFIPNQAWQPDARYRLTLVAGPDETCDANELCGGNSKALNTDSMCGTRDGNTDVNNCEVGNPGDEGGGPDIAIPFRGVAPSDGTYFPAVATPVTDVNGNGEVDPEEVLRPENSATITLGDVDGTMVQEAWFPIDGSCNDERTVKDGSLYLNASLPVTLGVAAKDCTIGADAQGNAIVVSDCIPAEITPQILYSTSLTVCTQAVLDGQSITIGLITRQSIFRMRQRGQPILGHIVSEPGEDEAHLVAEMNLYLDAPDMRIPGMNHDMRSKEIAVQVKGPMTFAADGRVTINLENTSGIIIRVNVEDALNPASSGFLEMTIPPGSMRFQLASLPSKDNHLRP